MRAYRKHKRLSPMKHLEIILVLFVVLVLVLMEWEFAIHRIHYQHY
jgi:hypothetical protein